MKILALDLGTHCGWAIYNDSWARPEYGTELFELVRGESGGLRFIRFRRWFEEVLEPGTDLVVYEQPHLRGGYATDLLVGFATRVQEICAERDVPYKGVHSGTIKKFATGSGKGSKKEMTTAATRLWNVVPGNDNEADALCLLKWAVETLAKEN